MRKRRLAMPRSRPDWRPKRPALPKKLVPLKRLRLPRNVAVLRLLLERLMSRRF